MTKKDLQTQNEDGILLLTTATSLAHNNAPVNKEEEITMQNKTIRQYARINEIPLWRIAQELGVCEMTLTRWLRVPLSEEREARIIEIIDRLSGKEVALHG